MNDRVVIIGAGLGGLLCGYMLARQGCKVTILEQNKSVGGCLRTFTRGRFHFDTGMHYVGSMGDGQLLNRFWRYFGLYGKIRLRPLDKEAFDIISLPEGRFPIASGYGPFVESLARLFPEERAGLQRYVQLLQEVTTSSPVSRLEELSDLQPLNPDYVCRSVDEYVDTLFHNPVLRKIIVGNLPLYGGLRGKTPFYIHAFIHNSYIQGAYRIVGGGQTVADALVESIQSMGGEILRAYAVTELQGEGKVQRALCSNGTVVEGDIFISDIHPQRLVALLSQNLRKRSYCRRVNHSPNTIGCVSLSLGFKEHTRPYFNSNLFHYDVEDIWTCADYTENDWPRGFLFMHQPPVDGGDFADTASMVSYMRYADVERWEQTWKKHRGEEYLQFKEEHIQRMLASLEKEFPGISADVEYTDLATPLTYRDYTGTVCGSMYGLLRDASAPTQNVVSQQTYLPNLYLTGQSTNAHGMLGVTNGALLTCGKIVGLNKLIHDINNE